MLANFSWIRDGRVAGMGMPYEGFWAALEDQGIQAVLTLTERPLPVSPPGPGQVSLHVPLIDFGTPSLADLTRCVDWIDEQLAAGRAVVVHCFAGIGRTGTVLASWLVANGVEAEEALNEIRRLRPGSVETPGQAEAVRRFARARQS